MKFYLQLFLLLICTAAFAQKKTYLIVGTYTSGKSEGVYVYQFDDKKGVSKLIDSAKCSNPSFIAVSPDKKFVYAVKEDADSTNKNGGSVSSFSFDKKMGKLSFINKQPSGGSNPCYVTIDKSGKWLFAGNYSSGNFSLFPLQANGSIDIAKNNVQHFGKGPNTERQEGPHVHGTFLTKDNKYLLVPDLGIDKVLVYQFDAATGNLTEAKQPSIQVPGGNGPRHLAFDPSEKHLYLIQELTGTVAAFNFADGNAKLFQTISTLPDDYKGSMGSADIHISPDGKFLYASNRGQADNLAIYSINAATGILKLAGHQSTLGKTPRNFNFDPTGNYLLVANQNSDDIVIFKINHTTGLLTDTGKRINVPNPVCVKWIVE
jgi:6-phosphogluconolactonase